MMNGLEIDENLFEIKERIIKPKPNAILYIDKTKDHDLIQFLSKAQQQGFNCLDLSKRNIKEFPLQILEFTSLQVNHHIHIQFSYYFFFAVFIFRR
jgi:hypothetical protein